MQNIENWDPTPPKTKKMPALKIPPIPGVRPFAGSRNPLTRSNTAHRVSTILTTPHLAGEYEVFLFESELESVVALEALMSPDLYHLEVQLSPIAYVSPRGRSRRHSFDIRITFRDGYRRGLFVRNAASLARADTIAEIDAIFRATPPSFADDLDVISGAEYSRARRDNLRRVFPFHMQKNDEWDRHVLDVASHGRYRLIRDLVKRCDLPSPDAMSSVFRLLGRQKLGVNWDHVISKTSKVWFAA